MTSSGRVAGPYGAAPAGRRSTRSATPSGRGRCPRVPATTAAPGTRTRRPATVPWTGPCAPAGCDTAEHFMPGVAVAAT